MTRYFDSSALLKRYFEEAGSPAVRRWFSRGGGATARYSLLEVASGLARRGRAGDLSAGEARRALDRLGEDATRMEIVELSEAVDARARELLRRHPLRAGDALQLGSALHLRDRSGEAVEFACFDLRLNAAARAEGLRVRGAK